VPGALGGVLADDVAFRDWYDATLPIVYGYLLARCGRDAALAEELTQQTFVDAIRSHGRSVTDDPVAWVVGIARHRLVDHHRARERRDRRFLRLVAQAPAQIAWIGDPGGDTDLAEALDRLPAAQRIAICLRYLDDLTVRDVAHLMGRSEGAVESLLQRGRDALRRTMDGAER
jgi:RNA polymerase sigma-70 factor, ECF subfamily